jgi:hypothetical protein
VAGRVSARVVTALVVATLALAGCATSTQANPVKLDRKDVPYGLLDPSTSTVPPTTVPRPRHGFFVYYNGPVGVTPVARSTSQPLTPNAVVQALLEGPTTEEAEAGLHTSIPKNSIGNVSNVSRGTATIDLAPSFTEVSGSAQTTALQQLVLSVTLLHGVQRVRFLLSGRPVSVPRPNGPSTLAPVTRADYLPPRSR